jgi:hypothetical protein
LSLKSSFAKELPGTQWKAEDFFLWNIPIYRQGEILARKSNKCYPEWVVFFIYWNMADLNVSTGTLENQETVKLSNETQTRVNTVANAVIVALDKDLDAQKAVKDIFG